jgi:hypothetical protein
MRMRRHFQPMLDSMPSRIAPSAVGGLLSPVLVAHASLLLRPTPPVCVPQDTEMPETGPSTPANPQPH